MQVGSMIERALISVYDKAGVVDFARQLHENFQVEIISSGGTAKTLSGAGIPVTEVSKYTGAPEMFGGRVKTLHPMIEGGILYIRSNPEHVEEAQKYGVLPIDMVVCNLYPFRQVISKPGVTTEEAIEMIDIGGPTMVRAAAKNYKDVAVVTNPDQYQHVLDLMRKNNGEIPEADKLKLARQVFLDSVVYDAAILGYLDQLIEPQLGFPRHLIRVFELVQQCRYGENWDQRGVVYKDTQSPLSLMDMKKLHGKELSYNNFLDLDTAVRILIDLTEFNKRNGFGQAVAILKHTNPNGVAVDRDSQLEATNKAYATDTKSVFGGIWGFNKPVEVEAANVMKDVFVECVIAPSYQREALEILSKKNDIRLLEFGDFLEKFQYSRPEIRSVLGGILAQDYDTRSVVMLPKYDTQPEIKRLGVVSQRGISEDEMQVLEFAQINAKWAKSNAAVFVKPSDTGIFTLSVGSGQQSRVDAVELAIRKAKVYGHDLNGSYMGTDSFFPFPDGLEAAAEAGCVAIIAPGSSIRDTEVIQKADELGMGLFMPNKRVFRH